MATDGMDIDPGSLRPSPLAIATARTSNAVVAAPAHDLSPSFYVMNITVGTTTRILDLPAHDSFMKDFSKGLSDHHFTVWVGEDGRFILPEDCYAHYLNYPSSVLHAEFGDDAQTVHDSTPSQTGAGSKRRRVEAEKQTARTASANQWVQEQIVRMHHSVPLLPAGLRASVTTAVAATSPAM
jgi:hypothetical protein